MKGRIVNKTLMIMSLLKAGHVTLVVSHMRRWLRSNSFSYGLCRDLGRPFDASRAKIPLTVRSIEEGDIRSFLRTDTPGVTSEGFDFRLRGLSLLKAGLGTCYVAMKSDNSPCYVQWLMDSRDNEKIQAYFKGAFPRLGPDEALVENVFTQESYRGLGIMPDALSRLCEVSATLNLRRMIAFVDSRNAASLRGFKKAGFLPFMIRKDRWRLFHRHSEFVRLTADP